MLSWLIFVCGLLGYQSRCNIAEESKRNRGIFPDNAVLCDMQRQVSNCIVAHIPSQALFS